MQTFPPTKVRIPSDERAWTKIPETTGSVEADYAPRAETRERVVRGFEYSHYPRNRRNQQRQCGLTRDESNSGLCAVIDQPEARGTLLQIALQTLDGEPSLEALALIVWCRPREDGRYDVGLSFIERSIRRRSPLRVVRRAERTSPERLCA
jgi:hypothetical protein